MATQILLKRGEGAPLPTDLEVSELAIDTLTGDVYTKLDDGEITLIGGTGEGGGGAVVSEDIPLNPSEGDLWYCTKDDQEGLYLFSNGIWFETVEPGPQGEQGPAGEASDLNITFDGEKGWEFIANGRKRVSISTTGSLLVDKNVEALRDLKAWKGVWSEEDITAKGNMKAADFLDADGNSIIGTGGGGGISYTTETSDYTLAASQGVIADTTGGTFVVTLPLTPSEGDQVVVADGGDWSTTNLTVAPNGSTIEGVASDLTMDVGGLSITMVYDGTTWQLYPATGTSGSAGATTLDQVTAAGNTTTNDITVGNLTSTGIDDNATATAITIDASGLVNLSGSIEATTAYRAYDSVGAAYRNVLRYDNGNLRLETGSMGTEAITAFAGGQERLRIDNVGNVGIGTDVPDGKLSVFSASAGNVSADADADELVLENSGNVGLSLLTASTGESSIYFGNPGSGGQKDFSLKYYHESHPDTAKRRSFTFNSASQQLMCVNNSGNVLVGTDQIRLTEFSQTDSGINLLGQSGQKGQIQAQTSGATTLMLSRRSSDGDIVEFRKDGENVGTIGTSATVTYMMYYPSTGIRGGSSGMIPATTNGEAEDNTKDWGSPAYRFRNGYFGGTVTSTRMLADRVIQNGAPVIDAKGLISTLSTLRKATMDETTLEGLRDSIGNAIGGLIEKFEAEIAAMPAPEPEVSTMPTLEEEQE